MRNATWITATLLAAGLATTVRASLIDPLDTADNFNAGFGGTTATANGDGTVTLTRNVADIDAGIDWLVGGTAHLPLNFYTDHLVVVPVGTTNGGYYSISILYFDDLDVFIDEKYWIVDSNSVAVQDLSSVAQFGVDNGVSGAAFYMVRFRIQPFDQAPAEFTFTQINAIPEPASALIVLGLMLMMRRRRGWGTSVPQS